MGFLTGKKKIDAERGMLEIRGTMNALTLRIRKLETRSAEEQRLAREAMSGGDRTGAKSHLTVVVDLDGRRARYHQQFLTLETALMSIEEARDQAEVLKAFSMANDALAQARKLLTPTEIQTQLDKLSQAFEEISIAGELLSEDLSATGSTVEAEEKVDKQLEAMEAEILLEKEGVLPPISKEPTKTKKGEKSQEKKVDDLLADLEKEAREEREKASHS